MRRLGIVAAAVATIVLTIPTASGCGSTRATAERPGAHAQRPSAEVAALLAGIPQHGRALGDPGAPMVVQFFGDLQCPFCRRFALGPLNALIEQYVRSGKLKIEYRSLETATRDQQTFQIQQVAALAAGLQNRLWNFVELFYRQQREEDSGYVTEGFLQGLAQQVGGLNLIAWTAARGDRALVNTLIADAQGASAANIGSTPSFRLGQRRAVPYLAAVKKLLTG